MKKHWQSFCLMVIGIGSGLIGVNCTVYADSVNATLNFTTTFVGGSCEISAPASIQFNDGNLLMSADIENKTAATIRSFYLTLSNCSGWGLKPSIRVTGNTTSDFGPPLFRDELGRANSNGYGVLLATTGNESFLGNNNLAKKNIITASDWDPSAKLNVVDISLPIVATLTCGNCNYSGRQGGDFKATVTFDFVYE